MLPPFASLARRSPRGVVGPSTSSSLRWNYNSAGAKLVHAFDSRRAVCELFASRNTQILAWEFKKLKAGPLGTAAL